MLHNVYSSSLKTAFCTRSRYCLLRPSRLLSSQTDNLSKSPEDDHVVARRWLANLHADTIPRNLCEITFSRSSGPGGQNVNKVNSKATVRLKMMDLLPLVPSILHPQLQESRYYAPKSGALVIQADGSRKQTDNVQECFKKLQDLILSAGRSVVRGETTPEQIARAKRLQKVANENRLKAKRTNSTKKSSRRGGNSNY